MPGADTQRLVSVARGKPCVSPNDSITTHCTGTPVKWCGMRYTIEGNVTALLREAALSIPDYECDSPVVPSDFDSLISGYRLIGELPYCRPMFFQAGVDENMWSTTFPKIAPVATLLKTTFRTFDRSPYRSCRSYRSYRLCRLFIYIV